MLKRRSLLTLSLGLSLALWAGLLIVDQRLDATPQDLTDFTSPSNYSEIEKGLFMGGLIGKPPPKVEAVLNTCREKDPYTVKHHKWMPIDDGFEAPSLAWLRSAVDFVDENRSKDRPTYVHCYAGISRSGMVVTAYLMRKHNWTRDEALAFVRKSRPIAEPNPAFMELLKEWERKR